MAVLVAVLFDHMGTSIRSTIRAPECAPATDAAGSEVLLILVAVFGGLIS